ncbi:MAG: hypothetical protein QOD81_1398 [Solirubrobacteraceae bacterium]|nr:hypothetical protein [Solirubrobacteraceae bacterium]
MRALREFLLAAPPPGDGGTPAGADGLRAERPGPVLVRLRDALLAPPAGAPTGPAIEAAPRREASAPRAATGPSDIAVLCAAEDAVAVAIATAAVLARRHRSGCALACVWISGAEPGGPEGRPVAAGPARRLADVLGGRGLDALACGRAATVRLPADPAEAVVAARRATAAAGAAPAVLVVGGARAAALDPLLADRERVVVLARGGADPRVGALALAGLAGIAAAATFQPLALGPGARALAAAGLAVPPALRRALGAALEEDRA